MKLLITFFITLIALTGCNKPDPNPEKKDPIFADLNTRLGAVTAQLNSEIKTLEGHEKALAEVVPQTGQIKFAQKRVYESKSKIRTLEQEQKYLKLKILDRTKEARASYRAAFKKGEAWPNPAEYDSYLIEMKLRNAKTTWDVKKRMEDAGVGAEKSIPKPAAGGSH